MVIRDRHLRHQKLMLELAEPPASAQTANHSAVANEKPINKLFYGAQKQLISVQDMLHQLVMILQEDYKEVDASGVSSVYGAVAKSVNEMNRLAKTWRDEAAKADEKRQSASASRPDGTSQARRPSASSAPIASLKTNVSANGGSLKLTILAVPGTLKIAFVYSDFVRRDVLCRSST